MYQPAYYKGSLSIIVSILIVVAFALVNHLTSTNETRELVHIWTEIVHIWTEIVHIWLMIGEMQWTNTAGSSKDIVSNNVQIQISENRAFHNPPKCSKDMNLKEIMEPVFLRKRRAFYTPGITGFSNPVEEVISYLLC